jgi:hypothetical protein
MRWLSMRRRLPVRRLPLRVRLARLRRRRLRRLWLLRVLGTLPHLLKGALVQIPSTSPSQALRDWPGLYCASSAHRTGAISIGPNA